MIVSKLQNPLAIPMLVLVLMTGVIVALLPPKYTVSLAIVSSIGCLAVLRPRWLLLGLLLTKASLDQFSQQITFFENTIWTFNLLGLLNVGIVLFVIVAAVGRYVPFQFFLDLPASKPYLLFLIFALFGLIISKHPVDLIREWFRLASPFAIYILAAAASQRQQEISWFVRLVILSALVPISIGIYQIISGAGYLSTPGLNRVNSTFWYPASCGFYFLIVIMLLIPQIRIEFRFPQKMFLLFLIGLCSLLLLHTYTRSAWVGVIVAVCLWGLFYSRRLLLTTIMAALVIFLIDPSARNRLGEILTPQTFSLQGTQIGPQEALGAINTMQWRLIFWNDMLPFIPASPWIGHGLGSFDNLAATTRIGLHIAAHNDYLRILVETGIIGFVLFLWLQWRVLLGAWKVHRWYLKQWQSVFAVAFIGLYTAILSVSFVDNVLSFHTLGWYLWAYAGIIHQLYLKNRPSK